MRIVFLITMGVERPSGRRYFHIARGLAQRGHQVRILALHPDLPNCPQRRFVRDGVEVWYVGPMHVRKSNGYTERYPPLRLLQVLTTATCGMIWAIICSPATVYHLGKPQPVNGLAALLGVLLGHGQRFYVDCDDDERTSNHFSATWQRAVFAFWQWLLPHLARGVTVNTHYLAAQLPPSLPVAYVPNGVDLAHFQRPPAYQLAGLCAALGLEGRRVVAYCGTLTLHNHPVDLLVAAFAQVVQAIPNAVLLLIGDGSDMAQLRHQCAELGITAAVRFTGAVPHTAMPAYLALADLSIDPVYDNTVARSRSPLKLFESLALGVPVVTGDVGDRTYLLAHGRAGVLVAPGNVAALTTGMISLLTNETKRRQMQTVGQQHVRQFNWDLLTATWEQFYLTIQINQTDRTDRPYQTSTRSHG